MEANQSISQKELNQFINVTQSRHLNINQLLRKKYHGHTQRSNYRKELHAKQLQKLNDLYQLCLKHR